MSQNPTLMSLEKLSFVLKPGERLMGLDLGAKTIGVALSDTTRMIATAYRTIRRGKFRHDGETLGTIVAAENIAAIILGLPANMNGTEGPRAQATRAFTRNLTGVVERPIVLWDERLSTRAVTRMLLAADTSRARRKNLVDKLAAAYILQGALDRLGELIREK